MGFKNGQAQIWRTGQEKPSSITVEIAKSEIALLASASSAQLFASADTTGTVRLWSSYDDEVHSKADPLLANPGLTSMALSADGKSLVDGGKHGRVSIWDTTGNKQQRLLQNAGSDIAAVSISSDGRLVAAGTIDGTVTVWRMSDLKFSQLKVPQGKAIVTLAFSADGQRLAAVSKNGIVRIWTVVNNK